MFVIVYLIRSISEIRTYEYHTITSYIRENQVLGEKLALYQRVWNGTVMLVNKIMQAITIIKESYHS